MLKAFRVPLSVSGFGFKLGGYRVQRLEFRS